MTENVYGQLRGSARAQVARTIDAVAWGLFFVWIGLAVVTHISWGAGFLGVGAITLGAQAARKHFGLRIEWLWLVIGMGWLVWGLVELLVSRSEVSPLGGPAWGHGMPWPVFWWVFPLMFFVMMAVMISFVIRGGMRRVWMGWMADRPEYPRAGKRSGGEPAESAVEILNKRYAKGEIDKQEYEEKMAAITRAR